MKPPAPPQPRQFEQQVQYVTVCVWKNTHAKRNYLIYTDLDEPTSDAFNLRHQKLERVQAGNALVTVVSEPFLVSVPAVLLVELEPFLGVIEVDSRFVVFRVLRDEERVRGRLLHIISHKFISLNNISNLLPYSYRRTCYPKLPRKNSKSG